MQILACVIIIIIMPTELILADLCVIYLSVKNEIYNKIYVNTHEQSNEVHDYS